MKIALTADLHLTSRDRNPERFETLENVLAEMRAERIETLIIAGDLFDDSRRDYSDFERLCSTTEYQDLEILVIPGNHDPAIDNRKIVVDNIEIITEPSIRELDGRTFLFLPYEDGKTMGEAIAQMSSNLVADKWVLVSHGDWAEGLRVPNPSEPGVYMPLTRGDIQAYKPMRAFLGHIHAAMDAPPVCYIGSPCGLDITETGRRRCLLYDTETNQVEAREVDTPVLYFNESFVIVPADDEAGYLRAQIEERKRQWDLSEEEKAKVQLRVKVAGYSADRLALQALLKEAFEEFAFYKGQQPDIDDVRNLDDMDRLERQAIAEQVQAGVQTLDWPFGGDEPDRQDVLLEALHIIYGR